MIRLLCSLLLASHTLSAAGLTVAVEHEEIPERGPVLRLRVKAAGETFLLNPPPTWTMEKDMANGQLIFRSESLQSSFTVRFAPPSPPESGPALKKRVQELWPAAVIEETLECHARDHHGPAMEFHYPSAGAVDFRTRLAVLNYPATRVEITLTGPDATFARAHSAWTYLINSFMQAPPA